MLLIIESMLPYTLCGIAYVATLGAKHNSFVLFLSLYVMFTVRRRWTACAMPSPYHFGLAVYLAPNDHPPRPPGPRVEGFDDRQLYGFPSPLGAGSLYRRRF